MERARARVVRVRESMERERRDIPSSMATQGREEAGGGTGDRRRGIARGDKTNKTVSTPQSQMVRRGQDRCFGMVSGRGELPGYRINRS